MRRTSASRNSPGKYFENRVYGEKEAGGTQVLYLSHVDFDKLGLPRLPRDEHPRRLAALVGAGAEVVPAAVAIYAVIVAKLKAKLPRARSRK